MEIVMIRMSVFFLLIITGGFMMQLASDSEINASSREDTTASIRPASDASGVQIIRDFEAGRAEVWVRGEHFTTYNFRGEDRIPNLWPVHAEGGVTITRNFPMGKDEPEGRNDHRHHQSIWVAFGSVNGNDFWHHERIVTESVDVINGESYGLIKAENVWIDNQDEPVVDEIRVHRFHDSPASARIFDLSVTFRATYGDVTFGDDKEGMIAFRIRPEIQGNLSGVLTNANGDQTQRNVYGTPVPWMDYSGPIEGYGQRGIALFSHPSNFRLPAWHVRDYGLAGSNFFAMKNVAKFEEEGTYVLSKGEEITFHVRFLIHSGNVEEAEVAQHYAEYAMSSPMMY
jgi:hypothetical protein